MKKSTMKIDDSKLLSVMMFVAMFAGFGNSDLVTVPRDTVAVVGQTAYFNCSTTAVQNPEIHWHHYEQHVYAGGNVLSPYERFIIDIHVDNSAASYNLVIPNVTKEDAGIYLCLDNEGFGEKRSAQLVVLDENPVCESATKGDRIIGPNDCNIEPEDILLSCSATYKGDIPPILKWTRLGESSPISTGRTMCRNSTNRVDCNLTIKADQLQLDGSSYICHAEQTTNINCTSDAIDLIYSFDDFRATERSIYDELSCKVNSSEQCNNRWIFNSFNGSRTSRWDQSNVTAETSGIYRCESECNIRGKRCTISAMLVYIPSDNTKNAIVDASMEQSESMISSSTASQNTTFIVVSTILAGILFVCVVSLWICYIRLRKLRESQRNKSNTSEHLQVPLTSTVNQEYENSLRLQNELKMENERLTRELETSKKDYEESRKHHNDRESEWLKKEDELNSKMKQQAEHLGEVDRKNLALGDKVKLLVKEICKRGCSLCLPSKAHKDCYKGDPVLVKTIRTKAAVGNNKGISGLAISDTELFMTNFKTNDIEVFDLKNLTLTRSWKLGPLVNPYDMAYCNIKKCLYVMDITFIDADKKIFRVDRNGNKQKTWSTRKEYGCISVTYDCNVLVTAYQGQTITEYTTDGEIVQQITLPTQAGFIHSRHAIKLVNGLFLVSHGEGDDSLHRVCVVDIDGDILMSFGGPCGSTSDRLWIPIYLTIDSSGSILVIDRENSRVLAFSAALEFMGEIISSGKEGMHRPERMVIDQAHGRLLVAHNDAYWSECRVFVFQIL